MKFFAPVLTAAVLLAGPTFAQPSKMATPADKPAQAPTPTNSAQSGTTTPGSPGAVQPGSPAEITPAAGQPGQVAPAGQPTTKPVNPARAATARPGTRGKAPVREKGIPGTRDGVLLTAGKVQLTEFGSTRELTDTTTAKLTSGIRVSGTGLVTRPDGTTEQLREGDYMSLSGRLTTARMKMEQDSIRKAEAKQRKMAPKKKGLFGR